MNCEHCGAANPLSAKVCQHCKTPLSAEVYTPLATGIPSQSGFAQQHMPFGSDSDRRARLGLFYGALSLFVCLSGILGAILCIIDLLKIRKTKSNNKSRKIKATVGLVMSFVGIIFGILFWGIFIPSFNVTLVF